MAVEMNIVSGTGAWLGGRANLENYSVEEEATPITGEDSSGATGQLSFGVVAVEQSIRLMGDEVELTDQSNGRTRATVSALNIKDGAVSVTADSRLSKLVAEKSLAPYSGTLGGALTAYLGACGISTGYVIDSTLTGRSVTYPAYTGEVWEWIKQLCIVEQMEVTLVSSNIIFRPLRTRTADVNKNTARSVDVSNGELAQAVEVVWYDNQYRSNEMVYPKGGWTPELEVFQVDAGETVVVEIPVDVSLVSVQQPTVQAFVDRYHTGSSVYAVAGNDGLPIQPAQWIAQGGSLTVAIGEDSKTLVVTIVGASEPEYAPYSISVNSGTSNRYSALRIIGTGVFFNAQTITFPTGVPSSVTAQEVGVTIDMPAMSTMAQAVTVGVNTAMKFAGSRMSLSASTLAVNRSGEPGTANYYTFGQFDAVNPLVTFNTFDTTWSGQTFAQFDAFYTALAQDNFENQAFGNAAGARVLDANVWYRIRQATITPSGIEYTAESDNTVADFDAANAGKTFAQFDALWSGWTFAEHALTPMRNG